ncbi:hypothetical protein P171DRAFT_490948 [Karstenula rhodostoma CBS 690.94]|uniref:Uncharacterized protein n=1 Tax=Karstenula rhodostoma CBS 690.94 TaxID=1392251 RepID=A0A9P4P8Q2_9PLEO|nr:hypothetical protein P171DRAFT_490948 [Karstenula rhodostoma CBS 690.94]
MTDRHTDGREEGMMGGKQKEKEKEKKSIRGRLGDALRQRLWQRLRLCVFKTRRNERQGSANGTTTITTTTTRSASTSTSTSTSAQDVYPHQEEDAVSNASSSTFTNDSATIAYTQSSTQSTTQFGSDSETATIEQDIAAPQPPPLPGRAFLPRGSGEGGRVRSGDIYRRGTRAWDVDWEGHQQDQGPRVPARYDHPQKRRLVAIVYKSPGSGDEGWTVPGRQQREEEDGEGEEEVLRSLAVRIRARERNWFVVERRRGGSEGVVHEEEGV